MKGKSFNENIISEEIKTAFGKLRYEKIALKSLIPGRPNPTYKYGNVVSSK